MIGGYRDSDFSSDQQNWNQQQQQNNAAQAAKPHNSKPNLVIEGSVHKVTVWLDRQSLKVDTDEIVVSVGCEVHTLGYWQQHSPAIARQYKYTEEERREYCAYFDGIRVMVDSLRKIKTRSLADRIQDVLNYLPLQDGHVKDELVSIIAELRKTESL